jgi:hypothetical protein
MICELNPSLTMKMMALGRPLHEAERIAAMVTVWVVLLCALTGYSFSIDGVPQPYRTLWPRPAGRPAPGTVPAGMRGILPAAPGTSGIRARTLLYR